MPGLETHRCTSCCRVLPTTEFYSNGDGYIRSQCKECSRARSREAYRKKYSTKEGREKKLASNARYRETRREQLAEAERLRRRKAGIPPKRHVDRKKVLDLYRAGLPVIDIAKQCNTTEHTVRAYAYLAHVHRERAGLARVCRNCRLYPCFRGIETMSSNLAETCRSWHFKGKKR